MVKTMNDRYQVWSSGGGVQSSAIAALIVRGDIAPPDLCVIADTGYEASTTWAYLDSVVAPALKSVGVEMHRVKSADFATVGLYSANGSILIPAYTTETGKVGKLPTYCSNEWKARVIQRFAKTQTDATQFDLWLGISIDEMKRVKQAVGKWQYRFPLIDQRMDRADCLGLVKQIGWPEPPRSSCWMCPNRGTAEWQYLHDTAPADLDKAIRFEKFIQETDNDLWLTASARPLSELITEGGMFTGRCDSGFCFT